MPKKYYVYFSLVQYTKYGQNKYQRIFFNFFFFFESDDYKNYVLDFCQSISFFFLKILYIMNKCFFTVTVTILVYSPVKLARFGCHCRLVTLL